MTQQASNNGGFYLSQDENPITYEAAQLFSSSNARWTEAGSTIEGYITITQENLGAILKALSTLEREVHELKKR